MKMRLILCIVISICSFSFVACSNPPKPNEQDDPSIAYEVTTVNKDDTTEATHTTEIANTELDETTTEDTQTVTEEFQAVHLKQIHGMDLQNFN